MKNSSYYIAPVGVRTHDLPHTVASNMDKVSYALTHSATANQIISQEGLPWVCPSKIGVEGFENRLFKLTMHFPRNINSLMPCQKLSFMFPTCEAEILHTTTNVKATTTRRSEGFDNISTQILTQTKKEVAHILNLSLYHHIFPNDTKHATFVPIVYDGNTKLFRNYRPTSILPGFPKSWTKMVCNRPLHVLETKISSTNTITDSGKKTSTPSILSFTY